MQCHCNVFGKYCFDYALIAESLSTLKAALIGVYFFKSFFRRANSNLLLLNFYRLSIEIFVVIICLVNVGYCRH